MDFQFDCILTSIFFIQQLVPFDEFCCTKSKIVAIENVWLQMMYDCICISRGIGGWLSHGQQFKCCDRWIRPIGCRIFIHAIQINAKRSLIFFSNFQNIHLPWHAMDTHRWRPNRFQFTDLRNGHLKCVRCYIRFGHNWRHKWRLTLHPGRIWHSHTFFHAYQITHKIKTIMTQKQ